MKKTILHFSVIACSLIAIGIMLSCKGNEPTPPPPATVIGVPTNLSYSVTSTGVQVTWSAVDTCKYEVYVGDSVSNLKSTTASWCNFDVKLGGALNYDTQYDWKVRAVKGGKKGAWASATLKTGALPDIYKFIGTWLTDSVNANASMAGNDFPLEQLLPGGIPPQADNISINIAQDGANNDVLFSVDGIDAYLPIQQQSLNNVPMQASGPNTITGSVTINYPYTYDFNPPMPISSLPGYNQIPGGSILSGYSIQSITVTFKDANIIGIILAQNKAHYTITINAPIAVKTDGPFDSIINSYFASSPMLITIDIYSTKQ